MRIHIKGIGDLTPEQMARAEPVMKKYMNKSWTRMEWPLDDDAKERAQSVRPGTE